MVHRVVFSAEAEAQLIAIYEYIANQASPLVALRFTQAIAARCEKLKNMPRRGTRRDDLRPDLRTIGFRRRVTLAFAVDERTVTIVGIFYGGRDVAAAMRPRKPS